MHSHTVTESLSVCMVTGYTELFFSITRVHIPMENIGNAGLSVLLKDTATLDLGNPVSNS